MKALDLLLLISAVSFPLPPRSGIAWPKEKGLSKIKIECSVGSMIG